MGKNDTPKADGAKRGRPAGSKTISKDFRAYLALEKFITDSEKRREAIDALRAEGVF